MIECESVRGKWGQVCPDCGVRLPKPKPLRSWMAEKYTGSQKHVEMAAAMREKNPDHFHFKHRTEGQYARRRVA